MITRKVKLGDVVELNPRQTHLFSANADVSFLAMADVSEDGKVLGIQARKIEEVAKGYTSFQNGDVLVAKITPCFENGKATLVHGMFSEVGFGSTEFHVLRPTSEICGRYLFHLVWNPAFRAAGARRMTGSAGQKRVPSAFILDYEIGLPPIEEQKRIAVILDKADSLRRKRQQAIRLADDFLRAVFLDMFGDPATNPKGWPILPMGEVIEFRGGSQPPKETFVDQPLTGYVRLVQIRDFKTDKYKTYIPEKLAKRSFEEDDVMIARYGPPVFQILRGLSGSYNVALMKAQPKACILKEIIYWLLQLPAYHDVVVANSERTAGQTGVNLELLNKLLVPLPPVEVQKQIADRMQKISKMVEKQKDKLQELNNMFGAIQAQFFA